MGLVRRYDRSSRIDFLVGDAAPAPDAIAARMTPEGYLRVQGAINRIGLQDYFDDQGNEWKEYRPAEEVFSPETLASWAMLPVTDDHPEVFVSSNNIREYQRGQSGDTVIHDETHTFVDLMITDATLIEKIRDGKTEISCGYLTEVIDSPGEYEGIPYRYTQTRIRGNHIAIVYEGRGITCALVLDSAQRPNRKDSKNMKVSRKDGKVMINEMEFDLPDEVSNLLMEMQSKIEEQGAELAKLKEAPMSEDMDKPEDMPMDGCDPSMDSKKIAKLQAQVDALLAEKAALPARIDARVNLVAAVRNVLPALKTDGVSDIDLKRAVVKHLNSAVAPKVDAASADYVDAAYEIAMSNQTAKVDSSADAMVVAFAATKLHNDNKSSLDDIRKGYLDSLRSRSAVKEAK